MKIDRDKCTDAVHEQSEERLSLALDAVGGGVFDWQIPTDEWVRSDSWYELTGFGREELAAWEAEHGSIIHPDDFDGMEEAFQRHVRREADRYHYEFRIRHKSGEWRWLLGRGLIVERDSDGAPLRMVGTDSDITARKRAEDALRENRALLKAVIEGTTNAIAVTDLDGRFVLVNPTVADWLGRPAEELVGRLEVEFHPPEIAARIAEDDRRVLAGENTGEFENTIDCDGTSLTYLAAKSVLRDERGEPVGLIGVGRDITRRKQAEEALQQAKNALEERVEERTAELRAINRSLGQSEERFRQLAENINQVFWLTDWTNKELLYVSPAYEQVFGLSCASLYADRRGWLEVVHQEDRQRVADAFARGAEQARYVEEEYRIVRPDGETRWIRDRAYPISGDTDEVQRIVGIGEDISERKRAEEALKEMNVALANAMPGIARLGVDGRYVEVNDIYAGMMGYRPDEMIGSDWKRTVHPDDHAGAIQAYERMLLEGKGEFEARAVRKNSTTFFKHVLLVKITDKRGASTGHHCFMRDISERRRAEQTLRERTRYLELFFEHSLSSVVFLDRDFSFVRVNAAYARACQRDPSEFIGKNLFDLYPSNAMDIFDEVVRTKEPFQVAARPFEFPDHPEWGVTYWDWTLVPVLDAAGEVELLVFSLNDVTEQTRAAKALHESEQQFRDLIESAPDAIILTDSDGIIVIVNAQTEAVFGYARDELLGRQVEMLVPERLRAGHIEKRREYVADPRIRSMSTGLELTGLRKDGSKFPIDASLGPISIADQTYVVTTIRDVTEQKRLEGQFRQAQKMEAVGQLAGGVAHDFNNILTVIFAHVELMRDAVKSGSTDTDQLLSDLSEIERSSSRAASLTRQLLTFSRRQVIKPRVLDPNRILADMEKMLRRLIREDIDLKVHFDPNVSRIHADAGQIEQVVMNLVVNAGDAMPNGGGNDG